MHFSFTLQLPRDALSVPLARRVLHSSMRTLGVNDVCLSDIGVAVSEACTNVLDHAQEGEEYEVVVGLDGATCVVEVVDTGSGFDAEDLGRVDADHSAEGGRGLQLIRTLVDKVNFTARPEQGTIVHLEKELLYEDDAPLKRLAARANGSGS